MGQERADAHHLRLEVLQQAEVLHEAAARLPGRADHEARAGLEADRLEVAQAAQAVFQGELRRVQPGVVVRVRRLCLLYTSGRALQAWQSLRVSPGRSGTVVRLRSSISKYWSQMGAVRS